MFRAMKRAALRRRLASFPFAALVFFALARTGEAEPQGTQQVAEAASSASDFERLLQKLEAEEKALRTELNNGTAELSVVKTRIVLRGRAYYKLVRAGLLPAGGGFDSLVDHAAKVERTRLSLERDLALEKRLTARSVEIGERLTRLRAEREPLEIQREAMLRARTALAQADERRAAFARAFETSERPDHVAIYGADLGPTEVDARAGFRSLKGRLLLPITGRAEVRRVSRGGDVRGVELAAPIGTAVRSVAAGRVAFADSYDDYGLTVLLDHGDHYYTLYASLGSVDVKVGETIAAGARVGTVGGESGKAPALVFEVRKNADTLDAATWLGL
ncbi:MAG: peptidoglycan DD-metalloendopeptidase family protein [Polyangiaceae bacterium]|nr:peptidoglycan DD-metalloendopeptidase family protein [Polyangiaceae bacterium]